MTISTHTPSLDEIFEQAELSQNPVTVLKEAITKYPFVREYINLAVSEQWTTLDISQVPFKQYEYHRSMAGALLLNRQTWNIINSVMMVDIVPNRTKAIQFKALSEMLYSGESMLLSAILTKNVTSLYPSLTHEVLSESL